MKRFDSQISNHVLIGVQNYTDLDSLILIFALLLYTCIISSIKAYRSWQWLLIGQLRVPLSGKNII